MKKTFLILSVTAFLASCVAVNANAQNRFSKDDWFMGAQGAGLDFKNRSQYNGKTFEFDLSAFSGYFLFDRLAVDVMAGIDYAKEKGAIPPSLMDNIEGVCYNEVNGMDCLVSFGAGVRYYPAGNLFLRLGYNGKTGTIRFASYLNAKVGYDLFLSEKVFFEPAIYYEQGFRDSRGYKWERNDSGLGLSIGIGVRF